MRSLRTNGSYLLSLLEVEKGFRRISGYKELPQLMAALERESTEGFPFVISIQIRYVYRSEVTGSFNNQWDIPFLWLPLPIVVGVFFAR